MRLDKITLAVTFLVQGLLSLPRQTENYHFHTLAKVPPTRDRRARVFINRSMAVRTLFGNLDHRGSAWQIFGRAQHLVVKVRAHQASNFLKSFSNAFALLTILFWAVTSFQEHQRPIVGSILHSRTREMYKIRETLSGARFILLRSCEIFFNSQMENSRVYSKKSIYLVSPLITVPQSCTVGTFYISCFGEFSHLIWMFFFLSSSFLLCLSNSIEKFEELLTVAW